MHGPFCWSECVCDVSVCGGMCDVMMCDVWCTGNIDPTFKRTHSPWQHE